MKNRIFRSLIALAAGVVSFSAAAVLQTLDVSFTAQNFQSSQTTLPAPTDPVTGSYSISYDDIDILGTGTERLSQNITVNSIDLQLGSYTVTALDLNLIDIKFEEGIPALVWLYGLSSPPGFWMYTGTDLPPPVFPTPVSYMGAMSYVSTTTDYRYFSNDITSTTTHTSQVPIPAAAWLLAYGLLGMAGFSGYLKKRK